jgi:hypothetical protein
MEKLIDLPLKSGALRLGQPRSVPVLASCALR